MWGRGHDGAVGRAGQPVHARLRVGVHMADERREPEDGQRRHVAWRTAGDIVRRVADRLRAAMPSPIDGPGGDRRYRKGHTYPTVVRTTDPKGQLYPWRLEESLRLPGLSSTGPGRAELLGVPASQPHPRDRRVSKNQETPPDIIAPSNWAAPTPCSRRSTTGSRPPSGMAYGFHRVTNLIALIMLRCSGFDIRLPQPTI